MKNRIREYLQFKGFEEFADFPIVEL